MRRLYYVPAKLLRQYLKKRDSVLADPNQPPGA
jgi:hypothetical protein